MPATVPAPSVASPDSGEACSAEPEPPISLNVDVVHEAGDWGALAPLTEAATAAAAAVAAELGLRGCEACIALSSDAHVAQLNAAYRGKSGPTNVLSFPASKTASAEAALVRPLGDLVLAAETVAHEADDLKLPLHHHLQHLIVHGLLHLLGFDHETDEAAQAMETLEVRILARLGVGNPYETAAEPFSTGQHHTEYLKS